MRFAVLRADDQCNAFMISEVISAAADDDNATTISGRSKNAINSAAAVPTDEEITSPVAKKIAGKVIADNTAYGM